MRVPTSRADLGVYIHVPFCERVCPYCDFAVEAAGRLEPERAREYTDLLLVELELAARAWERELSDRRLATVYLGGGTPGLLPAACVERLLEALAARFGSPEEVTLELNPGLPESQRAAEFAAAGVTRLSVGVQSLHDDTLRRLGRAQRATETRRGLETCLAAPVRSVSADLIHGAPGQTPDDLFADLAALIELGVPHLSAYALTLEPGTPFARARERGELELPDEDTAFEMAAGLRARLAAAGLEQYEISSFARPGHRSRHNQRYWLRQDVLGLGPSAASLLDPLRFQNPRGRGAWAEALAAGRLPALDPERLPEHERRREALALGLRRLDGVSRAAFWRRFGARPEEHFASELRELRGLSLIADQAGQLRLTERGILFADEVFLRLLGPLTPAGARG